MSSLFGTDGIRTRVGNYPFTAHALHNLGRAIAQWAIQKYGDDVHILLGHDTRISCAWFKASLKSGLLSFPISITDAGVLPTPAVCKLLTAPNLYPSTVHPECFFAEQKNVSRDTFNCGLVISASHNAYHDNGIKIVDARTGKLTELDEQTIAAFFQNDSPYSYDSFGTDHHWPDAAQQYQHIISSNFQPQFLQNKRIVLDCANGAISSIAPDIFQHFGATTITIHNQPTGKNINDHCGAVHLDALQQAVIQHHADIGFAFDGDGDRLMLVSRLGQIKNGDDVLTLLSQHPRYENSTTIIGTVMTNQGFEDYLTRRQKKLLRTPVGDKYIAEALEKHNLDLGGEQSGHIIMRDYLNTGDGIFAALRVLEVIQATNNWELETFSRYPQFIRNIAITSKKDLATAPLAEIIEDGKAQLSSGRVLIRYSGTEPLLRIMVEAEDHLQATDVVETLALNLAKALT